MKSENHYKSYLKKNDSVDISAKLALIFLVAYFVLPQYFGVQIAGFDLTAQRIAMLFLLFYIIDSRNRVTEFWNIIINSKSTPFIIMYMIVLTYTMVYRTSINTFMYSFIEFLCFYLLIYLIKNIFGVEKFVSFIIIFAYILCILGLLEYVMQKSLFSYLITIPGLYTGGMIRSGSYRVMGPCNHSLAYGLMLITIVPLTCIDFAKDKVNLLQHKLLFILLVINVFLTGSRSTLAVFILEVILLIIFTSKENRKKTFFYIIIGLIMMSIVILITYNAGFGRYIMMQITSVVDEILDTEYAAQFGADVTTLSNSSTYRELLLRIFSLDWLNPLVGRGSTYSIGLEVDGFYIRSIDNFYVAQYIRFAYPGLITYLLFMFASMVMMIWQGFKNKSGIIICLLIGSVCYFINLWWLDTLQTIKYVYILFALFFVINHEYHENKKSSYSPNGDLVGYIK